MLAACQSQPSSHQSSTRQQGANQAVDDALADLPTDSVFGDDYKSTGLFDARVAESLKTMLKASIMPCMPRFSQFDQAVFEKCSMGNLINMLDPTGEALDNCWQSNIEAAISCAMMGTMVRNLRAEGQSGLTVAEWMDAERIFETESMAMVVDEAVSCAFTGGGDKESQRRCLAEAVTSKLGGDKEAGYPCLAFEDDDALGQCLGEAGVTALLEAAARRATQVGA